MKIYKYKDYDEYVSYQTEANKVKLNHVWVNEKTIKAISKRQKATSIICHGTRNGEEQRLFKKYFPKAHVIGTEISETASQFADTVQHDFHEEREDWLGKFDIVYSNSWDHSYAPSKSLTAWRNQLSSDGRLYIEQSLSSVNNRMRAWDPLEIYHDEILELFKKNGIVLDDSFKSSGGKNGSKPCRIYIGKRKDK